MLKRLLGITLPIALVCTGIAAGATYLKGRSDEMAAQTARKRAETDRLIAKWRAESQMADQREARRAAQEAKAQDALLARKAAAELSKSGKRTRPADGTVEVLYFSADWCPACRKNAPEIDAAAGRTSVPIQRLDFDAQESIASSLGVNKIPTLLVLKRGAVVERIVGTTASSEIVSTIESHL